MSESPRSASWAELYLDLVFVLAVGQLAHLVVAEPERHSIWIALGLFVVLWWTWIDFVVLYNRRPDDDRTGRLLLLAGTVPAGLAAAAVEPASIGHSAAFAASLAVVRLVLAVSVLALSGSVASLREPIARACLICGALFAISIAVPEPYRYLLWAVGIVVESRAVLVEDRDAQRRFRRERDLSALAPEDPAEALDAHHLSERFGLFVIILLGEIVVEAGQSSVAGGLFDTGGGWAALVAAMLLGGALWWLYFDSAAAMNLRLLELSGGSPTMARTVFATGHMIPAFALLLVAAGVGLLLDHHPPSLAYWAACLGIGIYIGGTRVFMGGRSRLDRLVRLVVFLATFQLARLHTVLSPHEYLWLLAVWTAACAALTTRGGDPSDSMLAPWDRAR